AAMVARGTPWRGALYCGLMRLRSGAWRVLEFNGRFGDPETEVMLPLVCGDLSAALADAARGRLDPARVGRAPGAVVAVTVTDRDYPGTSGGGGAIEGLDDLMSDPELLVFHAGTAWSDGAWRIRGGRAVHVAALAADRGKARRRVYAALGRLR